MDTQRTSIERNRITNSGDIGIGVGNSTDGRITDNIIPGAREAGIAFDGTKNFVSRNRMVGGGIISFGDSNVISRNYVANPPTCPDGCGIGISFEGGNNNVIERNFVTGSPAMGIRIDTFGGQADLNIIRRNFVWATGRDGIGVGTENPESITNTLVMANTVAGSGDDGIDVDAASTTLKDNRSVRNGDLGIEAVLHVTDGGGNRAWRNGNPVQSTNVRCTPPRY